MILTALLVASMTIQPAGLLDDLLCLEWNPLGICVTWEQPHPAPEPEPEPSTPTNPAPGPVPSQPTQPEPSQPDQPQPSQPQAPVSPNNPGPTPTPTLTTTPVPSPTPTPSPTSTPSPSSTPARNLPEQVEQLQVRIPLPLAIIAALAAFFAALSATLFILAYRRNQDTLQESEEEVT